MIRMVTTNKVYALKDLKNLKKPSLSLFPSYNTPNVYNSMVMSITCFHTCDSNSYNALTAL